MLNYSSYLALKNKLKGISTEYEFPLNLHNAYGTGGCAKIAVIPNSSNQLVETINAIKGGYPYFVIGGGSNLLVSDSGYDGVAIFTKNVNQIDFKSNLYIADCGVKLSKVISDMRDNCFGGLEFAIGIPATVGGGVAMNAGCYGKNVSDAVKYVVTENGVYPRADCEFSYRSSRFLKGETIIKVCFEAIPAEEDIIEAKIKEYQSSRKNPKGKTCGSVFKNDGYFAGKVIDDCNLKGYSIGGAKISEKHANFIVAEKGATSKDIYNLIQYVKEKVYLKKQIALTEEVVYLGEF